MMIIISSILFSNFKGFSGLSKASLLRIAFRIFPSVSKKYVIPRIDSLRVANRVYP